MLLSTTVLFASKSSNQELNFYVKVTCLRSKLWKTRLMMVSEKRASLFIKGLNYRGNLNSCRFFHTLTLATVSQFLFSEKSKFKIKLCRRSNNGCFNFFSRERTKPKGIWLYGAFLRGARLYACTN